MRLIILILASGILLFCPKLLLALNQETRAKILIDEWKQQAEKLEESPFKEKEGIDEAPSVKAESPKSELPAVFDKKITLRSSGVKLKTLIAKIGELTGYNVIYDH